MSYESYVSYACFRRVSYQPVAHERVISLGDLRELNGLRVFILDEPRELHELRMFPLDELKKLHEPHMLIPDEPPIRVT